MGREALNSGLVPGPVHARVLGAEGTPCVKRQRIHGGARGDRAFPAVRLPPQAPELHDHESAQEGPKFDGPIQAGLQGGIKNIQAAQEGRGKKRRRLAN